MREAQHEGLSHSVTGAEPMPSESLSAADLVGAWDLVGWEIGYDDGRTTHPFGTDAVGLIIYSADGRMNASISASGRPALDHADLRRAPIEQQAAAFTSYFSYAGRYDVADGVATHHVDVALNPAFVGSRQKRHISLTDNDLELSAVESGPGGDRRHVLRWRRADAAAGGRR
jgi:hypothetical protein